MIPLFFAIAYSASFILAACFVAKRTTDSFFAALLFFVAAVPSPAAEARQFHFIDRIAIVESGGDSLAIGDKGKARGAWQITEAAWSDVNRLRRRHALPEFTWEAAHDQGIGREYALQFLGTLAKRLTTALGRPPTDAELLASWQLGFDGFHKRGFSLRRVPASTRRAIERLGR